MGYYPYRMFCRDCKEKWNTAFISVWPMQMGRNQCPNPKCLSHNTVKIADSWPNTGGDVLEWEDDKTNS